MIVSGLSFNRYMVECEFDLNRKSIRFDQVLIDTWWNVNIAITIMVIWYLSVLIDTWWNVNTNKLGAGVEAVEVLIDTWWNVNYAMMVVIS